MRSRPQMPGPIVTALLAVSMSCFVPTGAWSGTLVQDVTIEHDGLTRYFDYYVPDGLPASSVPLVFVLHGGGSSNDSFLVGPGSEVTNVADQELFIAVYPNGTSTTTGLSGPSGSFGWNNCQADAGAAATTADDVGFISALIDWAAANFDIELERVYAVGNSNGGLMSYRLAFELSDRVAAIGAIVANLPGNSECPVEPSNPVSVLVINGTADVIMPWDGGQVAGAFGLVLSAVQTRDYWRSFLGTDATPTHAEVPDINAGDDSTVAIDVYCNGAEGSALAFYTVSGGGHQLPSIAHYVGEGFEAAFGKQNRDLEGAPEIWNFLKHHRLSGSPGACGDWCVGTGEVCDDGNTANGDGCSASCLIEAAVPAVPTPALILFAALLLGASFWMMRRLRFRT